MGLLLAGIVLVAAAFAVAAYALAGPSGQRVSKERLSRFRAVDDKPALTKISEGLTSRVEQLLSRRGWRPFTAAELELSGVRTPVASLVILIACIAFASFAVGFVMFQSLWVGVLLAAVVPFAAKWWIKVKAARRCKRFAEQLPATLQMTAASLRAGHSLPRALDAVAAEAEAPMSEELARAVNESRLGRDLVEALEQVSVRMKSKDFYWVAGAISAQRETGGNLNEILDQVSETIRERNHVRQQVHALSAEGRISAYILMALPVLIGGYYTLVNPALMGAFVDSFIGKLMLVGSLVMYVLGGFWMRSVVRIEF